MKEIEKIIQRLKDLKVKKIFIQFGEGLRLRIQDISKKLEKKGFKVVLCCDTCFGACDVRGTEGKRLGCDAILHIGHTPFVKETEIPVVYWEYRLDVDPIPILEKEIEKLSAYKKIGLLTSIQFVQTIPEVKTYLEKKGKEVFVHKALKYPGQILGCNLEAAKAIEDKVDCFLFVGAGKFHPIGVALEVKKPVFSLDLEKGEIYSLEPEKRKVQKIIAWNKAQLKDARKVGILVSWKKGQLRSDIFDIKRKLEANGKEVYLLAMDEILPEKLEGLKLDALINCACPRISVEDQARYKMPLLDFRDITD